MRASRDHKSTLRGTSRDFSPSRAYRSASDSQAPVKFTFYFMPAQLRRLDNLWVRSKLDHRERLNKSEFVRLALEAWPPDARVAVVATGGMSIGLVDAEMDRHVLDSLQQRDTSAIFALPRKWLEGRTGETYLFIATGGAAEHLTMDWQYFPGYRSPAGTGCGLGFALWR